MLIILGVFLGILVCFGVLLALPLVMSSWLVKSLAPWQMRSFEYVQGGLEGYEGLGSCPMVVISGPPSLMFVIWGSLGYYFSLMVFNFGCQGPSG